MATIKNTVKTEHKSTGSAKTVKDTQSVSKAQTRLGQASASAGRQFSAQANGLGGLVSAYAGAAANIFAITQAFSALSRAAQAEQTIQGTRTLAAQIGQSGDEIIAKVQEITRGQLSIAESAQNANIALSAGFNLEQFEQLTLVALKASIALGRNLPDALTRLTRGTAKIEPEILDELGIFIRLDKAVEVYADKLGKSAGSLTQFERSQAFLNAALEQGTTKFSAIDPSIEGSVASFERLGAQIEDLGQKFGALLAITIAPFADFISGNFTNTLSAFGLLLGIIFAKLGTVVRGGVEAASTSIANLGASLSERFANKSKTAQAASEQLAVSLRKLDLRFIKGSRSVQEQTRELIKLGRQGQLTTREAQLLEKQLLKQDLANKKVEASLAQVQAQLAGTSKFARGTAIAFGFLSKAARGVGIALNGILRFAGYFGLIVAGLQLVSSAIAKVFGVDLFKEFGEGLETSLKNLGNYFRASKESAIAAAQAIDKMTGAINRQQVLSQKFAKQGQGGFLGFYKLDEARLKKLVKEKTAQITRGFKGDDFGPRTRRANLGMDEDLSNAAAKGEISRRVMNILKRVTGVKEALAQNIGLEGALVSYIQGGDYSQATATLENKLKDMFETVQIKTGTGGLLLEKALTVDKGAGNLKLSKAFSEIFEKVSNDFRTNQGLNMAQVFGIDEITKNPQIGAFIAQAASFFDAAKDGALSASRAAQLSQGLVDILKKLPGLKPEIKELFDEFIESATNVKDTTAAIELLSKAFDATFGSATKAGRVIGKFIDYDTLQGNVKLLFREEDIRRNNLKILKETAKEAEKLPAGATLQKKALDAIVGSYEKIGKAVDKIEKSLDKQERKLDNQIKLLQKQASLQEAQADLKLKQAQNKENDAILKSQLAKTKNILDISKAQLALDKTRNDLAKQSAELREAALNREIKDLERAQELTERRINAERDANLQKLNMQQTTMGALPGFFTEKQGRQLQIQITKESINALEKVIAAQENALKEFEKKQEEIAKERNKAALLDFETTRDKIQNDQSMLAFQTADLAEEKKRAQERKLEIVEERKLQNEVLMAQKDLQVQQIEATKEEALAQLDLQKLNMDLLAEEAKVLKEHPEALAKALQAHIEAQLALQGKEMTDAQKKAFKVGDTGAADSLFQAIRKAQERIGGRTGGGPGGLQATGLFASQENIAGLGTTAAKKRLTDAQALGKIQDRNAQRALDDLIKQKNAQMEVNRIKIEALELELKMAGRVLSEKQKQIEADKLSALQSKQDDLVAKKQELLAQKNQLATQTLDDRLKSDTLLQAAQKATTAVGDRLGNSLQSLFTAMREGTLTAENFKQGVKDLFLGILADVQQSMLEEMVINPMKDWLSESVGGLFGFGGGKKIEDTIEGNAVRVKMVGGPSALTGGGGGIRGGLQTMEEEGFDEGLFEGAMSNATMSVDELTSANKSLQTQSGTLRGMFQQMETTGNPLTSLFGQLGGGLMDAIGGLGSFASSLLGSFSGGADGGGSGILGFVGGIGKSILGSFMGSASGGLVHMASGGQMRDRVPAMLEPGEFVIRKPMAKAIGGPALHAMNGTGKGLTPNIEVVVNNEGTPKDAQANVKPQIDVNKMVVEIVTRDIRNNGPIRKTLRGNS